MRQAEAAKLREDAARFWLERVKEADPQTVNDVLAILDWPEYRRDGVVWAKRYGKGQVFTTAIIQAGIVLAELRTRKGEGQ